MRTSMPCLLLIFSFVSSVPSFAATISDASPDAVALRKLNVQIAAATSAIQELSARAQEAATVLSAAETPVKAAAKTVQTAQRRFDRASRGNAQTQARIALSQAKKVLAEAEKKSAYRKAKRRNLNRQATLAKAQKQIARWQAKCDDLQQVILTRKTAEADQTEERLANAMRTMPKWISLELQYAESLIRRGFYDLAMQHTARMLAGGINPITDDHLAYAEMQVLKLRVMGLPFIKDTRARVQAADSLMQQADERVQEMKVGIGN